MIETSQPLPSSILYQARALILTTCYSPRSLVDQAHVRDTRSHTVKNGDRGMPCGFGNFVLAAFAMGGLCGLRELE
jgi:hypothetical protein